MSLFLVKYKLFCSVSDKSYPILTFVLNFLIIGHKFLDVINVCCCCLIFLFVLPRFLNNGKSHQSNAAFFTPLNYLLWRQYFCSFTNFLKNSLISGGFLSVPHFVDNYAKNVDERAWKFMCQLTLPSLLVISNFYEF